MLTWQLTIAKDVPATVRPGTGASQAVFLAAERIRGHLEARRQRLLLEAVRLGIESPELPRLAGLHKAP